MCKAVLNEKRRGHPFVITAAPEGKATNLPPWGTKCVRPGLSTGFEKAALGCGWN